MKLNLDANDVICHELTIEAIRNEEGWDELHQTLGEWLDEAQGLVFSHEHTETYLVIKVVK